MVDLSILEKDFSANLEYMRRKNKGEIHVAFSGGKDSTILLNMVRLLKKPEDKVFVNVYAENFYPEIAAFIKKEREKGEKLGENGTIQGTGGNVWKVGKEFGWFGNSKFIMRMIGGIKYCLRCQRGQEKFNPKKKKTVEEQLDIYKTTFKNFGLEHVYNDIVNGTRQFPDGNSVTKMQSCCGLIKESASKNDKWILTGMRAQERNRKKIFCKDIRKHRLNIMRNGTNEHEQQAIDKYNIEICSIYKYLNRTGCMFCPFAGDKSFNFCVERYGDKLSDENKKILEEMKQARDYFTKKPVIENSQNIEKMKYKTFTGYVVSVLGIDKIDRKEAKEKYGESYKTGKNNYTIERSSSE